MRSPPASTSRSSAVVAGFQVSISGRFWVSTETPPSESPSPAKITPARLPPSKYDRQRLYEEVWSGPTQQVAKRYGVSDVAIAKACVLLGIPKPPRGYWAKRAKAEAQAEG